MTPSTTLSAEPSGTSLQQDIKTRRRRLPNIGRQSTNTQEAARPQIDRKAFARGVAETNCAWFMVAFTPIRSLLKQKVRECLGTDQSVHEITLALIVDDALVLAFEASRQWHPQPPSLEWIADFFPQAIHEFGDLEIYDYA